MGSVHRVPVAMIRGVGWPPNPPRALFGGDTTAGGHAFAALSVANEPYTAIVGSASERAPSLPPSYGPAIVVETAMDPAGAS